MNKLYLLVGLPGSGKSIYAEKLKEEGIIVHSSDAIREELGDINDQSKNEEVFRILHKRIKNDLRDEKSVCYDATSLNRKRRIAFLKELKHISCKKICVLVATPYEMCVVQNFKRDRRVPVEVIWNMYKNFNVPCEQEGWDEIIVHYPNEEWQEYYGDIANHIVELCDFDQENHNHALTLGEHMRKAGNYLFDILRKESDVIHAAFTHDIGKVDTKDFKDGKGEPTEEAHYYQHHCVGSYKSLFFRYPSGVNKMYVSLLIGLHMKPHLEWKQSEKAKEKDKKFFGDKVYNDVMLIHKSDLAAH
jgi:predicted kinase